MGWTLDHSRRDTRYPRPSVAAPEETDDKDGEATGGRQPCSPCRGSGKVISNLGGKREEITCPWCDGGGTRLPEHNAQARFKDEQVPPRPDPGPDAA
jgi:hypothetical protein